MRAKAGTQWKSRKRSQEPAKNRGLLCARNICIQIILEYHAYIDMRLKIIGDHIKLLSHFLVPFSATQRNDFECLYLGLYIIIAISLNISNSRVMDRTN